MIENDRENFLKSGIEEKMEEIIQGARRMGSCTPYAMYVLAGVKGYKDILGDRRHLWEVCGNSSIGGTMSYALFRNLSAMGYSIERHMDIKKWKCIEKASKSPEKVSPPQIQGMLPSNEIRNYSEICEGEEEFMAALQQNLKKGVPCICEEYFPEEDRFHALLAIKYDGVSVWVTDTYRTWETLDKMPLCDLGRNLVSFFTVEKKTW